jgi:hypothetical protein
MPFFFLFFISPLIFLFFVGFDDSRRILTHVRERERGEAKVDAPPCCRANMPHSYSV